MRVVDTVSRRKSGDGSSAAWIWIMAFAATTAAVAIVRHKAHRRRVAKASEKDVSSSKDERKEEEEREELHLEIAIPTVPVSIVSKTMNALDLLPGLFPSPHKKPQKEDDHSKAETEETEPSESSFMDASEFGRMEPFRVQRIEI